MMLRRRPEDLEARPFDVLVVGGGIVGACVAWDAAQRGLSVALAERGDFAGGASSNSLKLVHGGLRHLQRLDFRSVRESIRERSTWLRIAPHLVEPLPVVVPAVDRGFRGLTGLRIGLAAADLFGKVRNSGLPAYLRLPPGRVLDRSQCVDLVPEYESVRLTGGILFYDARMYNSERLVLSAIFAARRAGAVLCNYVEVVGALRAAGKTVGAVAVDRRTGGHVNVQARVIVNAAGAGGLDVARRFMPSPSGFLAQSVAVNLVFPALGHDVAFALPTRPAARGGAASGRFLFVVPWRGVTMFGTGHYPAANGEPSDTGPEPELFAREVRNAYPSARPELDDVRVTHRGNLPDAAPAGASSVHLLRRARIVDHARDGAPELLSVISVKFTTARLAAERVVDRVLRKLDLPRKACATAVTPLPGAPAGSMEDLMREARSRAGHMVAPDIVDHLVRIYGTGYERILAYRDESPEWNRRVAPGDPTIVAQLIHGVREEAACSPDDLLRRRTELGARGPVDDQGRALAERIWRDPSSIVGSTTRVKEGT